MYYNDDIFKLDRKSYIERHDEHMSYLDIFLKHKITIDNVILKEIISNNYPDLLTNLALETIEEEVINFNNNNKDSFPPFF